MVTHDEIIDSYDRALTELHQQIDQMLAERAQFRQVLNSVRTGLCWCLVGIGHPSMSTHSALCVAVQAMYDGLARDPRLDS